MERSLTCPQAMDQPIEQRQQIDESQRKQRPVSISWRDRLYRWRQLRRERLALSNLSDDMLKDIGISREAVQREARRPFWDDHGWRR